LTRALAFLSGPRPPDYGTRLARLRWRRAAGAGAVFDWNGRDSARTALRLAPRAQSWVLVREVSSLPLESVPEPPRETILRAGAIEPPPVHTLRELESAPIALGAAVGPSPALAFRPEDAAPPDGETVKALLERLESGSRPDPGFRAVVFAEPSEAERPELTRRLPGGRLRILDAGCGAGGAIGLARRRNPGWEVVGIERNPNLAARARERCDRVLEGDLTRILPELETDGERFDALVFADVLEHLADPIAALSQARRVASEAARLLVSVPNAGHLSIARDLLLGRHDPVPAGLCDAGHLRWFTRASLKEALAEAGWRLESIEGEPGAAAPESGPFLELAASWPDADGKGLTTYQWIATARPA
jgi:SAM-dependent methyltransferase